METVVAVLGLSSLVVACASLVGIIHPMPRLGLRTRTVAVGVFTVSFSTFIFAVTITPEPNNRSEPTPIGLPDQRVRMPKVQLVESDQNGWQHQSLMSTVYTIAAFVSAALIGRKLWDSAWGRKVRGDYQAAVEKAEESRKAATAERRSQRQRRQEARRLAEEQKRRHLQKEQVQQARETRRREEERAHRRKAYAAEAARIKAIPQRLSHIAGTAFLVRGCPNCYENSMRLLSVSPNSRSIEYACATCGRRRRAAAANPEAMEALGLMNQFVSHYCDKALHFVTPSDPLPYEQTVREPIPEVVRTEVWRRDGGQCARCGRRENLQFDHIIPVKKGGATTVNNLQVLCRSCNLAKGTKI